jgi:very-short-patch-repair endonuclease
MPENDFNDLWDKISRDVKRESEYENSPNSERRKIIRRYYTEALPEIMELAGKTLTVWHSKYPFDWKFNANEGSLWASIACRPMVMYPEFPVLGYFVDFGNPFLKIAIEADSEKYHDKDNDRARDCELLEIGWKTFRVSYKENFTPFKELGEISEMISNGNEDGGFQEMEN